MTYIILLRGINVGGKNSVSMATLKEVLLGMGCEQVTTYINSGNVILQDNRDVEALHEAIESALHTAFGFEIKTLVIPKQTFDHVAAALPQSWRNDDTMRCDVLFLWKDKNTAAVLDMLPAVNGVDTVKYVDGAVLWCVPRKDITRSGLRKLIGTEVYRHMTARNCNTVRTLAEMAR
ncbi:MAG TPA: DUF1697 domain-containing protein [Candidatus Saccharimonadales bacterium]|nr:DUF1697 domain-containing protein [Candidatus Saccharimonadales bacterium]